MVNYIYNSVGLLINAAGSAIGTQTVQVWKQKDTDGNGKIDARDDKSQGEFISQFTPSESTNSYVVLYGQAQVVKSVTTSYAATLAGSVFTKITDAGAHGYSKSVATVDYSFNGKGQLMGAVGSTVGDQNSEVWTDTNRNNCLLYTSRCV